jgi:hypothetical protein
MITGLYLPHTDYACFRGVFHDSLPSPDLRRYVSGSPVAVPLIVTTIPWHLSIYRLSLGPTSV